MLIWPPCPPGPSPPANLLTTQGGCGTRSATGGRVPDFTCSANIGVSCRFSSGSAAEAGPQIRPKRKALARGRRFLLFLPFSRLFALLFGASQPTPLPPQEVNAPRLREPDRPRNSHAGRSEVLGKSRREPVR